MMWFVSKNRIAEVEEGARKELRQVNDQLFVILSQVLRQNEEIAKLQKELADAQRDMAVAQEQAKFLKAQRDQLANQAPAFAPGPLHFSEQEEDISFLGDIGLMSEKEVAKILDKTGFENTEVEFN